MNVSFEQISAMLALAFAITLLGWIFSARKLKSLEMQSQQDKEQHILNQERLQNISQSYETLQQDVLALRGKYEGITAEHASLLQKVASSSLSLEKSEAALAQALSQVESLREENMQLKTTLTRLKTEYENAQEACVEKLALLDDAKTKLSQEFQLLANKIFEDKQSKMTEHSKNTLDSIIKPMQQEMTNFRSRIEQVHKEDIEARGSLERHLSHLKELNQQMSQETLNLTHALKGDSKAQGNWGEMILEKLLESSGLREGLEFKREVNYKNDEGKNQRPDVIIFMPGDKQVIIDAKVSLTDYERAISSNDESEQKRFINAHVKSMQSHIQTLANKRYDHLEGVHSPDYVLMFMPIEGAYLMAIEANRSIFEAAFDKRIAVVTPSTLYATLKLIEQLWRYERQTENVAKLTKQAGSLHDKFVGFLSSFEDISKHIGNAQKSYDNALGQLKDGKGNLINRVKELSDLSGKAKKEIPSHLLDDIASDDALTLENKENT